MGKPTRLNERICCVKGCDNSHESMGLCKNHYSRMKQGYPIVSYREYHGKDVVCENGVCKVPLTKKLFAVIDEADAEEISQYIWCASSSSSKEYAYRRGKKGEPSSIAMHRVIARARDGEVVDHIDRDTLNNRRGNLRICTKRENAINKSYTKKGVTSKYRGVSWNKKDKKWTAQIGSHGKSINLGYFDDEVEAAKTYDDAAKDLHGEFACLNFPS